MYAEVGCFAGVGQKDEYLENELGRETSIIHSNQRGLIRRGALPLHLPRSLSKEFFYRGIWTFYAHQKRVDHPKNGTISQQLWDNITDLIQQKSRYQLAAGGANRKTRMWRIPSAVSSTSCFLQRWDHQEAGSDVLLMGSSRLNFSEVDRMVKWGLCIIWWGKNCSCRAYYL